MKKAGAVSALPDPAVLGKQTTGPCDEIYRCIEHNIDAVRDSLALMISGYPIPARIREYVVAAHKLETKEEIFSAMVVYGFLGYEIGKVSHTKLYQSQKGGIM